MLNPLQFESFNILFEVENPLQKVDRNLFLRINSIIALMSIVIVRNLSYLIFIIRVMVN